MCDSQDENSRLIENQIKQHHDYSRQLIGLTVNGYLAFAGVNTAFATLSLNTEVDEWVSHVILAGLFAGDIIAGIVLFGVAVHLGQTYRDVESLLAAISADKDVVFRRARRFIAPSWYRSWVAWIAGFSDDESTAGVSPLNPIAIHEHAGTFVAMGITAFVTAAVWGAQFVRVALL